MAAFAWASTGQTRSKGHAAVRMLRVCCWALSLTACTACGKSNVSVTNVRGAHGTDAATSPDQDSALNPADDGLCEKILVRAEPTVPKVLIALDRSASMNPKLAQAELCKDPLYAMSAACMDPESSVDRWTPSVRALQHLTQALEARVRFGLLTFPSDSLCGPGTLQVRSELFTAQAISDALLATVPAGGTPTGDSLNVAFDELSMMAPDEVIGPRLVLLVTDGQPSCPAGKGTARMPAGPDIELAYGALDKLSKAGIRTYVIGHDTQSDAAFAGQLDKFAVRGGTERHRAVSDEQSLMTELKRITTQVISCTYQLEMAPLDPSYVRVKLDTRQLNLDAADGWSIEGKVITLGGEACALLSDGKNHALSVEVQCKRVPLI